VKDLNQIQSEVHELAEVNGWWQDADIRIVPEKLALIHAEVSEALEEYRDGRMETWFADGSAKPEGFGVELADAIIRILDLAGYLGIDMGELVELKHEYNRTRPFRHGGKLA
jgi:NTP pyrophosphatase (non-canonical NTP hydrolase)